MSDVITLTCPPVGGGYYTFGEKYRIGENGVFVFGSNLRGAHGAGAALYAAKAFGAIHGKGEGFSTRMQPNGRVRSRCYALPTKDFYLRTRTIEDIAESVNRFKEMADMNALDIDPYWFYMTPVGTGLAGHDHADIAPLFKGAQYCWFPDIWKPWIGELDVSV